MAIATFLSLIIGNNMRYLYLLILLCAYWFSSCSDSQKNGHYENQIEGKRIVLSKLSNYIINESSGSYIGRFLKQKFINNELVIADIIQPALFFINKNGYITKILRWSKGEGPGEVSKIGDFEIVNDRIYISDQGNFRWSVFDNTGVFLKIARPFKNPRNKEDKNYFDLRSIHKVGEYLICSVTDSRYNLDYTQYKSKSLALLDSTLQIKKIFGRMDDIYREIRYFDPTSLITIDEDENIYSCQKGAYLIYKYDKDGSFIKSFGIKKDFRIIEEEFKRSLSKDEIHKKYLNFSATVGLFYSSKGFILQQYANVTDKFATTRDLTDRQNILKVYDIDGNYIESDILLPGVLLATNNEGNLLILERDEPGNRIISTYQVKLTED